MWYRIKIPYGSELPASKLAELGVTVSCLLNLPSYDYIISILDISCSEEVLLFLVLRYNITVLPTPFA